MDIRQESLKKHYEWRGKIEVISRAPINSREDLSLAYTPGVAEPCLEINKDIDKSYELTRRSNLVAVITDGTAVLGLGDIGPEAGMPVMEGKCALFKSFADVDAFPLCIKSKDVDEIVNTIKLISGSFGGINFDDKTRKESSNPYYEFRYLPENFNTDTFTYKDCINFITKMAVSSCLTAYKFDFIKNHNITFPDGLCFEDNVFFHKALLNAQKCGILNEKLYYRFVNDKEHKVTYVKNNETSKEAYRSFKNSMLFIKLKVPS